MYYIDFKAEALLFIDNIRDKNIREILKKEINQLKENPKSKGKILKAVKYESLAVYEKRIFSHGGFRIYYSISELDIIIFGIEYEGTVKILRTGTKKNQKKDIKKLMW